MTSPTPEPGHAPEQPWQRLDPRTLLTGPVKVVQQFAVPALFALIGVGSTGGAWAIGVLPVALVGAVVLGAVPWLTTTYRRTATHLEVRRGLLNRTTLTARLDRIRSVDLEAGPLRRLLGVVKVEIGTGVDETRTVLDSLGRADADVLRRELLHRAAVTAAEPGAPAAGGAGVPLPGGPAPPDAEEIARFRWSWIRFAPLNLAQLAVLAGVLGAGSQLVDDLPFWDTEHVRSTWDYVARQALVVVLLVGVAALVVVWLTTSLLAYVLRWYGLRVTREPSGEGTVLRRTYGLLTTRSTTVEEAKVRGAVVRRPFLVSVFGGADLALLTTGLEDNTPALLPSAPLPLVQRVGADVLGDDEPLVTTLVPHGGRARRRCHLRAYREALVLPVLVAVGVVVLAVLDDRGPDLPGWLARVGGWWWLPLVAAAVTLLWAVVVAEVTYARLGHRVTSRHLVAGDGALASRRTVLESDGIVGWVRRQTWFQRRAGLVTLVATTAAGSDKVVVHDVPLAEAAAIMHAATPRTVADFVTS